MTARVHDCVGALLVNEGRILLGRRSDDCDWLAGAWDVFGGHVEAGESGEQAIARELDEELGIVPRELFYLDCFEGSAPEPWRLRLYLVLRWNGKPSLRAEHAELRWCELDEATARLGDAHPDFARVLAMAVAAAAVSR